MGRIRNWWSDLSSSARMLAGVGGLLVVGSLVVAIWQAGNASGLLADLAAADGETEELADVTQALTADLAEAQQQLTSAEQRVAQLEETTAAKESDLADAAALAETLESEASDELRDVQRSLGEALDNFVEALANKEQAEKLVAELTVAYSDEIAAARTMLASGATSFACEWGAAQATDGKAISSVTTGAALSAFANSLDFTMLSQTPDIESYLSLAATLGEDRYGLDSAEIESIAIGCWQSEDAKLNATVYEHTNVLRDAALDAACTEGIDGVFGTWDGYEDTAVYQNWELTIGYDDSREYIKSIENRFGSVDTFLAIPEADLQAASDRCDDSRSLINPKSGGTNNVGDEIMPGTWKAYDVSDCYWARLAENGRIIDNQFGDALRITVTVRSSDGQFEISGCTFYYANP